MPRQKLHTVLIDRIWIGTLQNYFWMKGITSHKVLHNNHGELAEYESRFKKKLTKRDAIVISPLTEREINAIIDGYHDNEEFKAYQEKHNKIRLAYYEENYGNT